ncbi:DUF2789 family protein [Granulosicoccus sp. 3-233]|uniref:DUF2789 family protein n=1 Tax=Granulosicoccus sp. 3-233 TaxID=3417969 RepID=UPI003D351976
MDTHTTTATLETLMEQLGLPSDDAALQRFVEEHGPLPSAVRLEEAPFWNTSQSIFLQEAIAQDAMWAPAVDQLDALLRHS